MTPIFLMIIITLVVIYMYEPESFYKPTPLTKVNVIPVQEPAEQKPTAYNTHPVPPRKILEPSFPIISNYPTDPEQPAFIVKYIDTSGELRTDCLKQRMAKQIPGELVMPSSLRSTGDFANVCPTQESMEFKMWPF